VSIRLDKQPSTDGLGVKRWTYPLADAVTLFVFERPASYADLRYSLRVDHADGRMLASALRETKAGAIAKAQEFAGRNWE